MDMNKWDHKDEWHRRGDKFLVVVKHHIVVPSIVGALEGPHRWTVYAYIYPNHRLFDKFDGPKMFQDATLGLPFHGGCSFLQWHFDGNGNPTSVQVGADYNHLHDDHFCDYETADDARQVFVDADSLFDHLAQNYTQEE